MAPRPTLYSELWPGEGSVQGGRGGERVGVEGGGEETGEGVSG